MQAAGPREERREGCATIVVVDDDEDVRETVGLLLATEGHTIATFEGGEEALAGLPGLDADLVLLDVRMPGLDGFETCRRLRASPSLRNIPVILVTALTTNDGIVTGLDAGADEFLTKPVSGPELRARVRSMLRMKRQHDELAQSLRVRDELAHMIVHDMRAPIAAVSGYAELALARPEATQRTEWIRRIHAQSQRLSAFADEILLVSKLEHGRVLLERRPTDLARVADIVVQDLGLAAQAKGVELRVQTPAGPVPALEVDGNLMRRVVENLVANAIKFSPERSLVVVRLEPGAGGGVRLQVIDQGAGIPEAQRKRIFGKFEVVEDRRRGAPRVAQVGLGLYFCRLVVEAHGGRIHAAPNAPSGTVFTAELDAT